MDRTDDAISEDDLYEHVSSSPSINEEEIDFQYVYALKTFTATEQGQANAYKGDAMILLNDTNSYWWLVRMIKDSSIGFLPAEHIETPWERLARLNKYRNGENSSIQSNLNPFGRLFKSTSMKKKDKETSVPTALSSKSVSFMTHETYISASEWEYSDDESSINGLDDDSDEELASPMEDRTAPGPAELLKDSKLAGDELLSSITNEVKSSNAFGDSKSPLNSSNSNSDEESYVEVPKPAASRALLIQKTRRTSLAGVPLDTKSPSGAQSSEIKGLNVRTRSGSVPQSAVESSSSAKNFKESSQIVPIMANQTPVNIINDTVSEILGASLDVDKQRSISINETESLENWTDQDEIQRRSVSSPIPRRTSMQIDKKNNQSKRRSFLKTRSSIDVLFGLDKKKNDEKLQAPTRARNVSISSNSSNGSTSSGRSAFNRMFKRKKNKKQETIIEPGSPLTPDEENISNSPYSGVPWSQESFQKNADTSPKTDSLRHAASSDGALAIKNKHRDGYNTPPVSSNTTGPLEVLDERTTNIDFIANRASLMSSTLRKPRLTDLNKRPLSTPSVIRKSPSDSPRSLDALPWPSNHLSFHEIGPLRLPNGANLVDHGNARTSIISASDVPESHQAAEIDDSDSEEEPIQPISEKREVYPQHATHERVRSDSAASASTESTVPTLEEHYRGQSPANDIVETPRSNGNRMTNPMIKRFWNGSSASSIGSQHLEAPSMGSVITVSENSVLSVATADTKVQPFENLHPEISLMYKETHRRIDSMTSRIDMLLNIYKP